MTMHNIGIFEAKNHLSALVQKVRQGETFMITYRGQPAAMLISPENQESTCAKQALEALMNFGDQKKFNRHGLSLAKLRSIGRR